MVLGIAIALTSEKNSEDFSFEKISNEIPEISFQLPIYSKFLCRSISLHSWNRLGNVFFRKNVGHGLRLDIKSDGEVWATCLSTRPIYAQSFYLDREASRTPGDSVHKIYQQSTIKVLIYILYLNKFQVYDLRQSYHQMCTTNAFRKTRTEPFDKDVRNFSLGT